MVPRKKCWGSSSSTKTGCCSRGDVDSGLDPDLPQSKRNGKRAK